MQGGGLEGDKGKALLCSYSQPALPQEVRGQCRPFGLTAPSLPKDVPLLILKQNQQWIFLENLTPGTEYEFVCAGQAPPRQP